MKPEEPFVRHQPYGDRIVFALILDRKKMKERIMAGEASQIFLGLNENKDAEFLCDVTRPLGTFLIDFENDIQGAWNRFGIVPLYNALHVNRWKQPELEQQAGDFLKEKYATHDPVRQYTAVRIWNEYLKTREYRERDAASEQFVSRMGRLTAAFQSPVFQNRAQVLFDEETRRARRFELSVDFFKQVSMEDARIELWYPGRENPQTECAAVYDSFYPMIAYYANRLADWGLKFCKCKVCGKIFLAESLRYELCSGKCRKAQALQNKREFDARARENNYDLLYKNECQSWRNKIKRAERTQRFPADRLLKMQEAFETFIIKALSTTFNKVQFIIATHSPIVISSAKEANLILLDEGQGVTYLPECYGYAVEDVLCYRQESMSRPKNVKVLIDQINESVDDENFNDAEKALTQLKSILGEDNSEFKKLAGIVEDAKLIWES